MKKETRKNVNTIEKGEEIIYENLQFMIGKNICKSDVEPS